MHEAMLIFTWCLKICNLHFMESNHHQYCLLHPFIGLSLRLLLFLFSPWYNMDFIAHVCITSYEPSPNKTCSNLQCFHPLHVDQCMKQCLFLHDAWKFVIFIPWHQLISKQPQKCLLYSHITCHQDCFLCHHSFWNQSLMQVISNWNLGNLQLIHPLHVDWHMKWMLLSGSTPYGNIASCKPCTLDLPCIINLFSL